ncbi:hypothetical protein C8R46DRAFT_452421 [Mycena filopes]|nr:hypothetical protein C8R46DRAFT_452421 [Mycena filopes]
MRPSSSSLATALTPTSPVANTFGSAPTNPPAASSPKDSAGTLNPAGETTAVASSRTNAPTMPETTKASVTPQTATAPPPANASGSAQLPAAPKPKRKKRKVDLSIIQADLSQRHEKRTPTQTPVEGPQDKPRSLSSTVVPPSSQPSPGLTTPIPPSKVEITHAPTPPVVVPVSAEFRDGPSFPPPPPPAVEAAPTAEKDADVQMTDSQVQTPLSSAMDNEVNRVLRTLTVAVSPGDTTAPSPSADPTLPDAVPEAMDAATTNTDDLMHPVDHIQPDAVPAARSNTAELTHPFDNVQPDPVPAAHSSPPPDSGNSMDGVVDMDVDTPEASANVTQAEPGIEITMNEPPSEAALQEFIRGMVQNMNKRISDATAPRTDMLPTPPPTGENWSQREVGEWSMESTPLRSSDSLEDSSQSSKTGIKGGTVIACQRGLPSGSVSIDFFINQDQLDSITRWKDRSNHSESSDLGESLCITLLCFTGADVTAQLESSQQRNADLGTLLPSLECSWPENGGWTLNALFNDQRQTFPMSPPFALPSNGLLDMSPFLVVGKNNLRIQQTRDMSEYWLLLCAHYPTRSQLNEVERRRHKEKNWSGWLDTFSQPLQLPFSIPVEA